MPVTLSEAGPFLRHIAEHREDDMPRLVYADWLDEHDEPARAEFIRLQCELEHLPDDAPGRVDKERRERELLAANESEWASEGEARLDDCVFRRGFVDRFSLGGDGPAKACLPALAWHPKPIGVAPFGVVRTALEDFPQATAQAIRGADLGGVYPDEPVWFGDLLRSTQYHGWETLQIDIDPRFPNPLISLAAAPLAESLVEFRHTGFEYHTLPDTPDAFPALQRFTLRGDALTPASLAALFAPVWAPRWRELEWASGDIGRQAGTVDLSAAVNLERLTLRGLPVALPIWPALPKLRRLTLGGMPLHRSTIAALGQWPGLMDLDELRLEGVALRSGTDMTALLSVLERLRRPILHLSFFPGSFDPIALRRVTTFPVLAGLGLAGVNLTDSHLVTLMDSPTLAGLRELDLSRNRRLTAFAVMAVAGESARYRLRELSLAGCELGATSLRALAGWAGLADLARLDLSANRSLNTLFAELAGSPHLRPGTVVDLSGLRLDEGVMRQFRERLGVQRVRW